MGFSQRETDWWVSLSDYHEVHPSTEPRKSTNAWPWPFYIWGTPSHQKGRKVGPMLKYERHAWSAPPHPAHTKLTASVRSKVTFTSVRSFSVGRSGCFLWKTERRYGKVLQAETGLDPQRGRFAPLPRRYMGTAREPANIFSGTSDACSWRDTAQGKISSSELAWFACCRPLKHNILLYSDLNKILPAAQCYTKPKSFDQIWTKLSPIFIEKVLYTESCPRCLMCFAPPGTLREPGTNHQKGGRRKTSHWWNIHFCRRRFVPNRGQVWKGRTHALTHALAEPGVAWRSNISANEWSSEAQDKEESGRGQNSTWKYEFKNFSPEAQKLWGKKTFCARKLDLREHTQNYCTHGSQNVLNVVSRAGKGFVLIWCVADIVEIPPPPRQKFVGNVRRLFSFVFFYPNGMRGVSGDHGILAFERRVFCRHMCIFPR